MCFSIKTGLVTGRSHLVYGINCQDSLKTNTFEHNNHTYYIGVVADGCGEGKKSEMGSHLAVAFLTQKSEELLKRGVSENNLPAKLFSSLLEFLTSLINEAFSKDSSPSNLISFIKDHLLFTVIGFFVTPKSAVIYALGDGVVLLNDFVDIRDENNHPNYIAYHLVDDKYLKENRTPLPQKFDVYQVSTTSLEKLAVGTDAWDRELGVFLTLWDKSVCKNIQRTMNVLSKKEKRFKDDAAIITLERT